MKQEITVDSDAVRRAFENARRRGIRAGIREGFERAGRRIVLPRVVALAPNIVAPYIAIKATTSRVYVTTRGPRLMDRIAGLTNYGGTVTAPIEPVSKRAVTPAPGVAVAAVTTPRRHKGQLWAEKGIAQGLPRMADAVRDEIVQSFDLPTS